MNAEPTPIVHAGPGEAGLLGPGDPPPFDLINPHGSSPLVLICDHAGLSVPKALGDLGLPDSAWARHISHDIGARRMTEMLSADLDAVAVMHNYSRLVIDCNRPLGHPESIIAVSDDQPVPANERCTTAQAALRENALFWPYHQTISSLIGSRWRHAGRPPILFSVHSFTPRYGGTIRPWDAGVLYNRDPRMAKPMMEYLRTQGLNIGDNQPYSGLEAAFTIDVHGAAPGIAHMVIEVNQDQVGDEDGQRRWVDMLGGALREILDREDVHRVQRF
ncbi:MAG: N-formylglutamate amidohydrolase [Rhodospirillales bacterium]